MRKIKGTEGSSVEKVIEIDVVKRVVDLCFVIDPEAWASAASEKGTRQRIGRLVLRGRRNRSAHDTLLRGYCALTDGRQTPSRR